MLRNLIQPRTYRINKFSLCFWATATLMFVILSLSGFSRLANVKARRSVSTVNAKDTKLGCCGGDEANKKEHVLAGSYYTLKDGFSAQLLLNNKGPVPIEVQPTLFSLKGARFNAPLVTVDATAHLFIDFNDWVALAGEQFREGSVQLKHVGKDLVLGTQIYLTNETHSLGFEEKLTELGQGASTRLEGVWWLPSPKGEVTLVLSNTTDGPLTVSVKILGEEPKRAADITLELLPYETKVLNSQRYLVGKMQAAMSSFGSISVSHNGTPHDVLARAMAADADQGFSLPIQFSDPGGGKSNRLQGAGLRIGRVRKEPLSQKVVVHNAGQTATSVTGRVPYTKSDKSMTEVNLSPVELAPDETRVIDVSLALDSHGIRRNEIVSAGLELEHTGPLGSLITSAFSVSLSGNHVFRVPLWDIAAQRSATGGYPWFIDGNSATVVYVKNVTAVPQHYRMYLKLSEGEYVPGLTTVAPGQTALIDVRRLRDGQIPDVNGKTIPLHETQGQVQWSMTGGVDRVLIGRSEQVDLVSGTSSNYACQNCCGNSFYDGWVTPGESSGIEGYQLLFTAMQRDANCYGQAYLPYPASVPSYFSTDNSVCDPGFTGLTTGVGTGTSIINAGWTADAWFMGLSEQCEYTPVEAVREAICAVRPAVDFVRATMYSATSEFNTRVATLNALDSGRPEEICGDDSGDFEARVFFNLPAEATGLSNTRSGANEVGEPPNINDFILRGWRFENVNTSSVPKKGEMLITLLRRGGGTRERNSISIKVAGDYGTGTFSTEALVKVVCP